MKYDELLKKYEKLQNENDLLKSILKENSIDYEILMVKEQGNTITNQDKHPQGKVSLFKSLFVGRDDVVAKQFKYKNTDKVGYVPYCKNDWRYDVCPKKKGHSMGLCKSCDAKSFVSYSDTLIKKHLRGEITLGIYPMLEGDMAKFLVIDFDKEHWKQETILIAKLCDKLGVPYAIERSRSGNGAHLWFFFEEKHKAAKIRQFGFSILNQAMQQEDLIKFSSYDRLFPNQDFVEKDGFGNLIALPFQGEARNKGNSVFVDLNFNIYKDQWAYLHSVNRIDIKMFEREIDKNKTFETKESSDQRGFLSENDFKDCIKLVLKEGISISKSQLTPKSIFAIRKLASYNNSEFYKKQQMRQSTYNEPRVIYCALEENNMITIPRGL
jgi:hypothetical protein